MANEEYTLQAAKDRQERIKLSAESQNIRRLQKNVQAAKAELQDALLNYQNRIMGGA